MAVPAKKSFDVPDEHIAVPGITADVIELADTTISATCSSSGPTVRRSARKARRAVSLTTPGT